MGWKSKMEVAAQQYDSCQGEAQALTSTVIDWVHEVEQGEAEDDAVDVFDFVTDAVNGLTRRSELLEEAGWELLPPLLYLHSDRDGAMESVEEMEERGKKIEALASSVPDLEVLLALQRVARQQQTGHGAALTCSSLCLSLLDRNKAAQQRRLAELLASFSGILREWSEWVGVRRPPVFPSLSSPLLFDNGGNAVEGTEEGDEGGDSMEVGGARVKGRPEQEEEIGAVIGERVLSLIIRAATGVDESGVAQIQRAAEQGDGRELVRLKPSPQRCRLFSTSLHSVVEYYCSSCYFFSKSDERKKKAEAMVSILFYFFDSDGVGLFRGVVKATHESSITPIARGVCLLMQAGRQDEGMSDGNMIAAIPAPLSPVLVLRRCGQVLRGMLSSANMCVRVHGEELFALLISRVPTTYFHQLGEYDEWRDIETVQAVIAFLSHCPYPKERTSAFLSLQRYLRLFAESVELKILSLLLETCPSPELVGQLLHHVKERLLETWPKQGSSGRQNDGEGEGVDDVERSSKTENQTGSVFAQSFCSRSTLNVVAKLVERYSSSPLVSHEVHMQALNLLWVVRERNGRRGGGSKVWESYVFDENFVAETIDTVVEQISSAVQKERAGGGGEMGVEEIMSLDRMLFACSRLSA